MFRILLIVGLLLAGLQQSLARGNVDVFETGAETASILLQVSGTFESGQPVDDPVVADNTPSYCKSSDCKAVIGSAFLGTLDASETPDIVRPVRRSSISARLEPRPPNS